MSRMRREINKVTGAVLAVMQMLYWSVVVNREENEGKAGKSVVLYHFIKCKSFQAPSVYLRWLLTTQS